MCRGFDTVLSAGVACALTDRSQIVDLPEARVSAKLAPDYLTLRKRPGI